MGDTPQTVMTTRAPAVLKKGNGLSENSMAEFKRVKSGVADTKARLEFLICQFPFLTFNVLNFPQK